MNGHWAHYLDPVEITLQGNYRNLGEYNEIKKRKDKKKKNGIEKIIDTCSEEYIKEWYDKRERQNERYSTK